MKDKLLAIIDDCVAAGWTTARTCAVLGMDRRRVWRWQCRRDGGEDLADRRPGGNAIHGLLDWEIDAIVALAEEWGPIDRSHRKLAHRGFLPRAGVGGALPARGDCGAPLGGRRSSRARGSAGRKVLAVVGGHWASRRGTSTLESILASSCPSASLDRSAIVSGAAQLAFIVGELDMAAALHEINIGQLESLGSPTLAARSRNSLAVVHLYQGNLDAAEQLATRSLEDFDHAGEW